MVGREVELEVVGAFAAGEGSTALVFEGEAGIGKTTLLREAVAGASGAGAHVLTAWPAAAEAALAFYVDTPEEVDAAYQRCLDYGAKIHFPPEEDRDIEGYYEMFVFDPDGMRIEVACAPPEES